MIYEWSREKEKRIVGSGPCITFRETMIVCIALYFLVSFYLCVFCHLAVDFDFSLLVSRIRFGAVSSLVRVLFSCQFIIPDKFIEKKSRKDLIKNIANVGIKSE